MLKKPTFFNPIKIDGGDFSLSWRISLTKFMTLNVCLFLTGFTIYFGIIGIWEAAIIGLFVAATNLIAFTVTRNNHYKWGIALMSFSTITGYTLFGILFGRIGGMFFPILVWLISIMFFYDNIRNYWPLLVVGSLSFLGLEYYYEHYQPPFVLPALSNLYYIVLTVSLIYMVYLIEFLKKISQTYRQQVATSHKALELKNRSIEQQHRMLVELTEELKASEEELKQNNEELHVLNENIVRQKEIMSQSEEQYRILFEKSHTALHQLKEAHHNITDSINYANNIQQALFPTIDTLNKHFADVMVFFKPRNVVSGDFYWIEKINQNLYFAVADCTGHGVPGAFMSILGISLLNEIVRKNPQSDSGSILDMLRSRLKTELKQSGKVSEQKDGIDMAFGILNTQTLELQFSGAHTPIYIIKPITEPDGIPTTSIYKKIENQHFKLIDLKADRQPISVFFNEKPFKTHHIQLAKDNTIFVLTDGFADQPNDTTNRKFLSGNLKKLLLHNCHNSMSTINYLLTSTLKDWMGHNEQIDDILITGFRIKDKDEKNQ